MNGTYGIRKPASITSADCDIYYFYRPDRSSESYDFPTYKRLPSELLATTQVTADDGSTPLLSGAYNLRLPLNYFGNTGIYNVYIKPKEVIGKIVDVKPLVSHPDVMGIVLNMSEFSSIPELTEPNGLTGYRVEYFNTQGGKEDFFRIITSSNRCEPVSQNAANGTQTSVLYRFNTSSNLLFCTLTPSAALPFKADSMPYIGTIGQSIALVNTKFNPIFLEIEIGKHDIESVSTMLEGSQIRNLDAGLITTFNDEGEVYHQATYTNVTNGAEGIHHDVKMKNNSVVDMTERTKYEQIVANI